MLVEHTVLHTIFKTLGLLEQTQPVSGRVLQIQRSGQELEFSVIVYIDGAPMIFIKKCYPIKEFEDVPDILVVLVPGLYIPKIVCMICTKQTITIDIDYDIVTVGTTGPTDPKCGLSISYSFDESEFINCPGLLKASCTTDTEQLKNAIDFCTVEGQCITVELGQGLVVKNEYCTLKANIHAEGIRCPVVLSISYECLGQLRLIKTKTCSLYTSGPFVISDTDGLCVYLCPQ
jgi:hypothetical protein